MSTSRRDFLKTLGGMALLTIVPRQVLGEWKHTTLPDRWDGRTAERIVQTLINGELKEHY